MGETKTTTVVIAGLGGRGRITYAAFALRHPELMKVTGAADMNTARREEVRLAHVIPGENCFETAEEMFAKPKMADMAFICTQDADHVRHAAMAIRQGYDILLEKPVSADIAACRYLDALAREQKAKVTVCHVLRYTPFFRRVKQMIDDGALGDIVSIQASENVGYWHQSHSFVRGNWRRADQTSPMILAKCCHDMDMLIWLANSPCEWVSSFGDIAYFNLAHAPQGSTDFCLKGCKVRESCLYDAEKIYVRNQVTGYDHNGAGWMQQAVMADPTEEGLLHALETSPYGRCVFRCDNDVVDHQVVTAKMNNGITVSFSMCGFNELNHRMIHIMGTKADLIGDVDADQMTLYRFGQEPEPIHLHVDEKMGGHNGGDYVMLREMFALRQHGGESATALSQSLESHYMAMAAEESRRMEGQRVNVRAFVESFQAQPQ